MVMVGRKQAVSIENILLEAPFAQDLDGVELSYLVLYEVVKRYDLESACLVLCPDGLGPQLFIHGTEPVPPERVSELLARPPGLYTEPDVVDPSQSVALAAMCTLALGAHAARRAAAVDTASGLASRQVIGAALSREAARSARYGWPFVVVLLAVAGEDGDRRWPTLSRAVRQALRVGDEAGVAGSGRALAILGNAEADVARPFAARVGSALADEGAGDVELLVATSRAPQESVDPEELWRLASERMAELGGSGSPPAAGTLGPLPYSLELEIRALPGVVLVRSPGAVLVRSMAEEVPAGRRVVVVAVEPPGSFDSELSKLLAEQSAEVEVTVIPAGGDQVEERERGWDGIGNGNGIADETGSVLRSLVDLRVGDPGEHERAAQPPTAGSYLQYGSIGAKGHASPGSRSPDGADDPPGGFGSVGEQPAGAPRVRLLAASFDPGTGMSEVDLGLGAARGKGRAVVGPLVGGAQATLVALGALGIEVPYYVVSVERAPSVPGDPVVVVLAPRHASEEHGDPIGPVVERIGVASGADTVEAASKATLCALNRYLAISMKAVRG